MRLFRGGGGVLVLVVGLVVASCGDDGESQDSAPPTADDTTTATAAPATAPPTTAPPTTAPVSSAPGDEPAAVELPTTPAYAWRIAISPTDGTTLLAVSTGFFPQTRESSIAVLDGSPGAWTDQQLLPWSHPASTSDIDPFFTSDGATVLFSSIRPVGGQDRRDVEVWSVERRAGGTWADPVHVAEVGSPGDELFPSVGPDGALYVATDRDGQFDIWRFPAADQGWGVGAPLPAPITTSTWEFNPTFTPDGQHLVFSCLDRDGGRGAGDLWASGFDGSTFLQPVLLEAVSTGADEYHPSFSPDGQTFYFVRGGTLMQIPVDALGL